MIENMPKGFKDLYKPDQLPGEAIAEFVRLYMTRPQTAVDYSKEFMDQFIETLSAKDLKLLNKHTTEIMKWLKSNTREQMYSTMTSQMDKTIWKQLKEDFEGTRKYAWKKFNMYWLDANQPIKDLVNRLGHR
jgi:uncharacterized protein with von Willebrand factor type A (vWA) domain